MSTITMIIIDIHCPSSSILWRRWIGGKKTFSVVINNFEMCEEGQVVVGGVAASVSPGLQGSAQCSNHTHTYMNASTIYELQSSTLATCPCDSLVQLQVKIFIVYIRSYDKRI